MPAILEQPASALDPAPPKLWDRLTLLLLVGGAAFGLALAWLWPGRCWFTGRASTDGPNRTTLTGQLFPSSLP